MSITKTIKANLCLLALLAGTASGLSQIVIGPSGTVGPITFDARPAVTDGWTTAPDDGGGSGNDTTAAGMDTGMQTNLASSIQTQVGTSGTVNPPSQNALARFNSVNFYLQSRSTSVRNTKLMATLQNNTGGTVASVGIEYDFGAEVRTGSTINEQIPGFRVYWSLTGEADSWTVIPDLSSVGTAGHLTTSVPVGSWLSGGMLYILWLDDNGSDDDAAPTEEGVYTIDNVVFNAVSGSGPLSIANTNLPASVVTNEYAKVSFTFAVSGGTPSYQWYKGLTPILNATNATFTITNVAPANADSYRCVATNNINSVTSRVATLQIIPDEENPAVSTVASVGASIINVNFNEAVSSSTATVPGNYTVETLAGVPLQVTSVTLTNNNTRAVVRLAAPMEYAVEHQITVRGVQDLAQAPNTMISQTLTVPGVYNVPLFAIDHTWQYDTNGADLGTAWKEEVYDDSAWLSGQGIIGYEDSGGTITAFTTAGESVRTPISTVSLNTWTNVVTYYFRTTVVLSNSVAGLGLVAEGWVDDGAIIWINGQKAGWFWPSNTTSLVTPPDPVLYNTLAYSTYTSETSLKTITLDPQYLRTGTNVIAVEVHQNSRTSSDMVMGLGLNMIIPVPAAITTQPVGTNILEGQTLTLTVGTSGSLLNYQWYQNDAPVVNGNAATLSLTGATTNAAGNYYVVVTNGSSAVTSAVVAVSVARDTVPPRIFYAMMNTNSVNTTNGAVCLLTIHFTEPVLLADATNTANYFVVRELDGNTNTPLGIFVGGATLANGTNLTVQLAPKDDINVQNYRLYIGNIHDVSPSANLLATTNLLTYQRYLLLPASGPGGAGWKYDNNGADLGTAWRAANYNDSAFQGPMPGPFYTDNAPRATLPATWGQAWFPFSSSQTVTTYYYRTTPFALPTGPSGAVIDPAGVQLQMELLINDGAVLWLNGVELKNNLNDNNNPGGRYYMTNGTEDVRATTLAAFHNGGLSQRTPLYPINLLRTNVLAVEVHQSGQDLTNAAPDHLFAMQLIATYPPLGQPVRPLVLRNPASVSTNVNASITLAAYADATLPMTVRWYFNTNTLVQTTTVSTRTTNLLTLALNNLQGTNEGTYVIVVSNSVGVVTSAVANVTVLRPPTFVSQPQGTNVAVGSDVTFSVTAEGSAPLRYQWYLGNDRLFNQTNATLVLRNVQTDNAGNYTVVVANGVATNTSAVAALTITGGTATPPSLVAPDFVVSGPGGNFSLRVATEAGHTYTLQYNPAVENKAGWLPVAGASVAGDGTVKTLTETNAPAGKRFYRIAVN